MVFLHTHTHTLHSSAYRVSSHPESAPVQFGDHASNERAIEIHLSHLNLSRLQNTEPHLNLQIGSKRTKRTHKYAERIAILDSLHMRSEQVVRQQLHVDIRHVC